MGDSYNNEGDILVNIPDVNLNELADMYRNRPEMPHASSILTNGKRIREKQPSYIKFMSPRNCWRKDGTFFVLMEFTSCYELSVFTLDESCKNVYEALMKTKLVKWEKLQKFSAIPTHVHPTILKVIEDKKLSVDFDYHLYIYAVPKTVALKYDIKCSDEIEIRKLESSHADLINLEWPIRYLNSEEYIRALIEINGGYGVFLKSTGDLVAWAIKSLLGQLGMVQTLQKYQRKGYGSLAVKKLSKEIADGNETPMGTVIQTNKPAQNTFEKLGFIKASSCNFIHLNYVN